MALLAGVLRLGFIFLFPGKVLFNIAGEKRAEKLKELDEAALATSEEVMLARANSYKDESRREAAVIDLAVGHVSTSADRQAVARSADPDQKIAAIGPRGSGPGHRDAVPVGSFLKPDGSTVVDLAARHRAAVGDRERVTGVAPTHQKIPAIVPCGSGSRHQHLVS